MSWRNAHETCPYHAMPETSSWRKSVAGVAPGALDPVISAPFKISKTDKIATAGSCFAQHISRRLAASGYNYFVTEPAPSVLDAATAVAYNYGIFSARYGNVYTTRQLVQLLARAFGEFEPLDQVWTDQDGRLHDPFRPFIQPNGFASKREFADHRAAHFASVRQLFSELEVLVLTLGLTETWIDRRDGACYPVCPGCGAGRFSEHIERVNLSYEDVVSDLETMLARLKAINPNARVLLTVSPVPLIATHEDRHVLVSTSASKAILRAASDAINRRHDNVAYFPSYEIITGSFNRGAYFAEDLREVEVKGVDHVMKIFFKHFTEEGLAGWKKSRLARGGRAAVHIAPPPQEEVSLSSAISDLVCEEDRIDV